MRNTMTATFADIGYWIELLYTYFSYGKVDTLHVRHVFECFKFFFYFTIIVNITARYTVIIDIGGGDGGGGGGDYTGTTATVICVGEL